MKYFEHDTDASYSEIITRLVKKFKGNGYMVYFCLIELLAADDEFGGDKWEPKTYSWDFLCRKFLISKSKLIQIFSFLNENEKFLIESCQEFVKIRSNSVIKGSKRYQNLTKTPINVHSQSAAVADNRIEEKRIEEKRGEESVSPPTFVFSKCVQLFKDTYKLKVGTELIVDDFKAKDLELIASQVPEQFNDMVYCFFKAGYTDIADFKKFKNEILADAIELQKKGGNK